MISSLVRRGLPLVALAVLMGALVRSTGRPPLGADTYFHLRMGHEFLGGWSVAHPGHLSPFDTAQWVPTQWLAQIGMAATEDAAGLAGVMWVAGVVALLVALGTYLSCRQGAGPLPAALATAMAIGAAYPGLTARPQLLSYLLMVVVTAAWLATLRDGRPRWWLVAVTWLWAPVHGLWVVSLVIAVAAISGLVLDRRLSRRELGRLALVPVASGLVVAATPVGFGIYGSVLEVGSRKAYFSEWQPTDFTDPFALVLLAMFAVVLGVALTRTRLGWGHLLLVGVAGALAVSSVRTTTVAALVLAPLVAEAVQQLVDDAPRIDRPEVVSLAAVTVVCAAVLAPVVAARADQPVAPAWLDARLDAQAPGTRVLNDWDTGAYHLWRHPQLSLAMHGYGDVFTAGELERNSAILRLAPGWDGRVRELDADLALVRPDTPLGYALVRDLGWTVLEADDDVELLTPPGPG